jgi:hypothetical protein
MRFQPFPPRNVVALPLLVAAAPTLERAGEGRPRPAPTTTRRLP